MELSNNKGISNQFKGLMMSILFGIVGAILWAFLIQTTGYLIELFSIVYGIMVSQGFVWVGRSESAKWGVAAALVTIFCIIFGKVLLVLFMITSYFNVTFYNMLLIIDYSNVIKYLIDTFNPVELVASIIAIKIAYSRSFNKVSKQQVEQLRNDDDSSQIDGFKAQSLSNMTTPESEAR